jgi:dihydroneopterin aldolase
MSVIVADRTKSKLEVIVYSEELHDMLIELLNRNFGIKDLDHFVRVRYAYGKDDVEDFVKYRYLMNTLKTQIDKTASLLTNNLRAANSIYPTSMHEYDQRREFQNIGIANCNQLINQLQRAIKIFEVDINIYGKYINAIDREIDLIKKWRQRDNKIKSRLKGNI